MAHPAKLLDELKNHKPNASINHWVYGVLHTSRNKRMTGQKGLLAASEDLLIFKSGSGEDFSLLETSLKEIEDVEEELQGTVNMMIHFTDGGYMEMAYISRGNTKEFIAFLKDRIKNSAETFSSQ